MTGVREGRASSTVDDFLVDEGTLEEAAEHAIRRVRAWQIDHEMKARSLTKAAMARRMRTSRALD